ncbi:MAG: D-alanyl-D-alanine carboxypeptidase family protein [Chloroflexota bacterium]
MLRSRQMRLFGLALVASGLVLSAFGPPRVVDDAARPTFAVGTAQLRALRRSRVGSLTARAAILVDFSSNQVLWHRHQHEHWAPASTTKVMTALLTLENDPLDQTINIDQAAADEPGSRMGLAAGESFTVKDLLYGLLLPSGNDAAVALADQSPGGLPGFVRRMNQRARALGLADTHFTDVDGLDRRGHFSSAHDLAELARFALRSQPLFDRVVATRQRTIPASPTHPAFDLHNLNRLLGSYEGANGVKTGTTPAAGEDLIASATRNGHRLLAVVLGSRHRYRDGRRLLHHGFHDEVWLPEAVPLPLPVAATSAVPLPAWEVGQVQTFVDPIAGTVRFSLFGQPILTAPFEVSLHASP